MVGCIASSGAAFSFSTCWMRAGGRSPRVISPIWDMLSTSCLKRLLSMLIMPYRGIVRLALSAVSSH